MQQRRTHKKLKLLFLFFVVILLIGGISTYLWLHSITTKIFIPHTANSASAATGTTLQQALEQKKPFNILLVGYGGGNHEGPYLTDSIIVVHIDPKAQKVFLISIPRDTWVSIPTSTTGGSHMKINQAYSIGLDDKSYPNKDSQFTGEGGGGRLAEYVLSKVTGLPIDYFVGMDFSGFTHTIDTLGGVDINVQTTFDDYAYPIEGKETELCGVSQDAIATYSAQIATGSAQEWDLFPCRFEHLHFTAGSQHMEGETALKYVRSRHSLQDGTDFGRAQRQRNLILAVKQKVYSAGFIPKIIPFMTSLGDDLRTDLSLDDVKTLVQDSSEFNKYQVVSLALTDQNYLNDAVSSDGQDILAPKAGIDNWSQIHTYLSDEFSGKTPVVRAIVQVNNGTATPGLAAKVTDQLSTQGFKTLPAQSSQNHDLTKTTITVYGNVNASDVAKLKKIFHVSTISKSSQTPDYNVLVVIGKDYKK